VRLLYDWRSVRQYVLVSSTLEGLATRYYFLSECFCLEFAVLFLWSALSDERTGSAICSVITQWPESSRTRNHTLLPHLRLSQPGGPGSRIYIPQEQSGPVIPSGTVFFFTSYMLGTFITDQRNNKQTQRSLIGPTRNSTNLQVSVAML
jgi:hypothetical protein